MEKLNSQLTKLRKIGVFGGAFDPIHLGHLLPVKELQDKYRLDHVVYVPTGIPNSTKNIIATSEQRLQMLTMALEDYDFKVYTREITTDKTSYTFDTITSIKNDYKNTRYPGEKKRDGEADTPNINVTKFIREVTVYNQIWYEIKNKK